MTDIALDRSDGAKLLALRLSPKGLGQRGNLDRITNRRSRSVRFDIADRIWIYARHFLSHGHNFGLSFDPWGTQTEPNVAAKALELVQTL